MKYPKWKYRKDPISGAFQSTLVGNEKAETELGASWTDDPHGHGLKVVPYPAEIMPDGRLAHHATQPDANGKHPFGLVPTAPGINSVTVGRRV